MKHSMGPVSKCTVDLWNIEENQREEQVSKCVTVIPSRPQSTEVTCAPFTPPDKDVAIHFLMVDEDLTFWKENITPSPPPKTPFCGQSVSSAKHFKPCGSMLDKRQKLVQEGEEESEAQSQPWVVVQILPQRPSPGLPSHQAWAAGHSALPHSWAARPWGRLATSRRGRGTPPGRRLWGAAQGPSGWLLWG